ncbi:CatB-related O-acetyltransferase [Bdellovibrio sp. 22V]|uniref:CatB-related O-acetyltransferase n=1 Tax=Bdellovibrio sp. 22V TaxID=3044166 RepID=UPI0025433814|nr:CatB-related O-acetyltransferase [Bdellovibrio sp. 22V]WII71833.1 CatB-related O-acetyltransferase [Bdellovibrio sp. 22V]
MSLTQGNCSFHVVAVCFELTLLRKTFLRVFWGLRIMKILILIEYYFCKALKKLKPRAIKNSVVHVSSSVGPGSEFINSRMGRHSYLGMECRAVDTTIGSFCSIANGCSFGLDTHSINWVSTSPVFNRNRDQIKTKFSFHEFKTRTHVNIGHDVWIGENVVIKSGVNIGTGAVIGAGSVVTKDVPPYEIWGGVPAKLIRRRFPDDVSVRLLQSQWWNLDDSTLTKLAAYIQEPSIFLGKLHEQTVDKTNPR